MSTTTRLDGTHVPTLVRVQVSLGSYQILLDNPLGLTEDVCFAVAGVVVADGRKTTAEGVVYVARLEPATVRMVSAADFARLLQGKLA